MLAVLVDVPGSYTSE